MKYKTSSSEKTKKFKSDFSSKKNLVYVAVFLGMAGVLTFFFVPEFIEGGQSILKIVLKIIFLTILYAGGIGLLIVFLNTKNKEVIIDETHLYYLKKDKKLCVIPYASIDFDMQEKKAGNIDSFINKIIPDDKIKLTARIPISAKDELTGNTINFAKFTMFDTKKLLLEINLRHTIVPDLIRCVLVRKNRKSDSNTTTTYYRISQGYIEKENKIVWSGSDQIGDPIFIFSYKLNQENKVTLSFEESADITVYKTPVKEYEDELYLSAVEINDYSSISLKVNECVAITQVIGDYSFEGFIIPLINSIPGQ